MAENQVIDFDEMTYQQKEDLIIKGLLKVYNFTDPTATTLDWTSSMSGLHVPATMVLWKKWLVDWKFFKNLRVENTFIWRI